MNNSRRSSKQSQLLKDSMHSEALTKELQTLSNVKNKLEEDIVVFKRKVMDLEDSNNALRKQLVEMRRFYFFHTLLFCLLVNLFADVGCFYRESVPASPAHDPRKDAELKTLSGLRDNAERKVQALQDDLRNQSSEIMKLKKEVQEANARAQIASSQENSGAYGNSHANDLLKLMQLRAAAEKRAEEAEASLKHEQHSVWKLKQEVKMLESRMSEAGTRKSESTACLSPISNSPSLGPRNSQNSTMSLASTSQSSAFELQRMQRELKVMAEIKEAALQSLDSLRSELVDGVTNIEFSNLRIESKIGSGSFAEVYRGEWTRPCAIKKLRGLTKRRQLQDFYREAQILQMLNHAGIVQLMGICMNIPELYLVTELVVGGSLEGDF